MPAEDIVIRSALFRGDSLDKVDCTQNDAEGPIRNPFKIDVQTHSDPSSTKHMMIAACGRDDDNFPVHSSLAAIPSSTPRKRTRKVEIKRNIDDEAVGPCIHKYRSIPSTLTGPPVIRKESRHPEIECRISFDSTESSHSGWISNLSPLADHGIGSDGGFTACNGQYSFTRSPIEEISHPEDDDDDCADSCATKIRRLSLSHETDSCQSKNTYRAITQQQQNKERMKIWHGKHQHPNNFYSTHDVTTFGSKNYHPPLPPSISAFESPPVPRRKRIDILTPPHSPSQENPTWEWKKKTPDKTPKATPLLKRKTNKSPFLSHQDDIEKTREEKSRLIEDFETIGTLGSGAFGTVYKCTSRLDGSSYAVKALKCQARGRLDRDRMLKEVQALAALSDLTDPAAFHIVGYHQAWMEENRLYIQTELCTSTLLEEMKNGGSICRDKSRQFKMLREMLLALDLIHRNKMVHLDIKPENIFIKNDLFKLGDFGLVTKSSVGGDVEEGDSRYMCNDLLQGNHDDLTKCDIFSLGATMYEISLGRMLPADGKEWHQIRSGILDLPLHKYEELYNIIKVMMHPKWQERPSASELLKRRQLLSEDEKRLIFEKNRVDEAYMALARKEARLKQLTTPPKKPLVRAYSLNL